ncbi:hypothetical protein ACJ41O_003974 [Fusarium nematophilum]
MDDQSTPEKTTLLPGPLSPDVIVGWRDTKRADAAADTADAADGGFLSRRIRPKLKRKISCPGAIAASSTTTAPAAPPDYEQDDDATVSEFELETLPEPTPTASEQQRMPLLPLLGLSPQPQPRLYDASEEALPNPSPSILGVAESLPLIEPGASQPSGPSTSMQGQSQPFLHLGSTAPEGFYPEGNTGGFSRVDGLLDEIAAMSAPPIDKGKGRDDAHQPATTTIRDLLGVGNDQDDSENGGGRPKHFFQNLINGKEVRIQQLHIHMSPQGASIGNSTETPKNKNASPASLWRNPLQSSTNEMNDGLHRIPEAQVLGQQQAQQRGVHPAQPDIADRLYNLEAGFAGLVVQLKEFKRFHPLNPTELAIQITEAQEFARDESLVPERPDDKRFIRALRQIMRIPQAEPDPSEEEEEQEQEPAAPSPKVAKNRQETRKAAQEAAKLAKRKK